MKNFIVNKNASINGSSLKGYFIAPFSDLVVAFGEPQGFDDYKVSTQWVFESDDGEVFTLYDYKVTSLYEPDYDSVDQFRARKSYEWHIGGKTDPSEFIEFLTKLLRS